MDDHLEAVRRAAGAVDVPGAPLTLRLDSVEVTGQGVRLDWSFEDPESHPGDRRPHGRRIQGHVVAPVPAPATVSAELAREWWAEAQLAAAHRFKQHVDSDALPGEPYVRRVWTAEEARDALIAYLGAYGLPVIVEGDAIRVDDGTGATYLLDPQEWADYLTDPETSAAEDVWEHTVPTAQPLVDGLPLWVTDELGELSASGGTVTLVDGALVTLDAPDL